MAIKLLIGGSPCTHWSIAQKNNRETEPSGIGWELFKNYLIAKEKFKPDFFLYENNKSAAQAIKDQIAQELGVGSDPQARFTYINSALVSAQNRQRFYVTNFGDIEQPEDRGILLKDILETSPFGENKKGKAYCLDANYYKGSLPDKVLSYKQRTMVAEPVCVAQRGRYTGDGRTEQQYEARTDGKTNTITTVQKDNYVTESVCMRYERSGEAKKLSKQYEAGEIQHGFRELSELHPRTDGKSNTVSTVLKDNPICEPIRIGCYPSPDGTLKNSQGMRLYSIEGKSVNLTANGGGVGAKTGLYAIPAEFEDGNPVKAISCADGKTYLVYQVLNGQITIKDKQYPIKLADGYYIIRKLTVRECARLQTMDEIVQMLYIDLNEKEVVSEKCFAHPRTDAPFVEGKCHKLPRLAENALNVDLQEYVQFVANNSSIRHPQTNELALLNVRTNYEGADNRKGYSKGSLKNANTAEKSSSCLLNGATDDFVQAIVGINLLLQRMQQIGEVELHLNDKPFAVVKNGKMQFTQCGAETIQRAKDVVVTTNEVDKIFTSIISEVSQNTQICEQMLTTLFCYVLNAIGGYTLSQTNGKILFSINLPYTFAVSDTACYKGLGNGWTAEVIIHLLNHALKDVPKDEEIVVLSLYDGIGTGRYCLDKMGFTNVKYHAYEIDKYPMAIANDNYPDIIQHGDAFAVREDSWSHR